MMQARSNAYLLRYDDRTGLGHDSVLRVRRGDRVVIDRSRRRATCASVPSSRNPRGLIAAERLAQDRQIALAVEAVTAVRVPRADDVVAGLDLRDFAAHGFDDACAFVTQHDRQRIGKRALDHFEIGVTEAARADAHQHIAGAERCHLQRLDGERLVDLVEDGGLEFHRLLFRRRIKLEKQILNHGDTGGALRRYQKLDTSNWNKPSVIGSAGDASLQFLVLQLSVSPS